MVSNGPESENPSRGEVTEKGICDFFLSARGCLKGERCEFLHEYDKKPLNESHSESGTDGKKLCSFYLTDRGCLKGDRCDFLHPTAPNGSVTKRICDFFNTTRGCSKTEHCDFLHIPKPKPDPGLAQLAAMYGLPQQRFPMTPMSMFNASPMQMFNATPLSMFNMAQNQQLQQVANKSILPSKDGTRLCAFYPTARGCIKGERCEFGHAGVNASKLSTPDSYYGANSSARLQSLSAFGAGGINPGLNPGLNPEAYMMGQNVYPGGNLYTTSPKPPGMSGGKICSFFLTARGCRKGDRCDFVHLKDGGNKISGGNRYTPY